ncbi:MAG: hydrogenase formation protein HypD [Verrucomicrobiae bacterium]|nr:hydrogenase formation protein HypD [Verrucomicrobiae bacterium]MCX7915003.1 hydrogenase formation protein HypD [Verrucomicrobiae bacterium]MDW8344418.1 hydrogenase formation protein HypD [Verrucomicrobiae bacterium]
MTWNQLTGRIHELARLVGRDVYLMEVCGTHTMAAFRSGLRQLLPANVHLISGPGCPVCVTDTNYIDAAIELTRRADVTVATFGDLLRVPGSDTSLEQERAVGGDVRIVYSPTDALMLARQHPRRHVVFLGVGFETTAPTVAFNIWTAARDGVSNFHVLCAHKTMPRAMEALLKDQTVRLDGFMCPGHVSVITGLEMYEFIARDYWRPCVVTGFEPADMLEGIAMLLAQIVAGVARVENQYTRSVTREGNRRAQELLAEVFEPCDASWRGLGVIPGSGLAIRPKYAAHDAAVALGVTFRAARVHPGCRCGDVLRGVVQPTQCPLFGKACTPLSPFGPCMVSAEGTCAAHYKYGYRMAA